MATRSRPLALKGEIDHVTEGHARSIDSGFGRSPSKNAGART